MASAKMWTRSATTHVFRVILVHQDRLNGNEIINYFINYDYKLDGNFFCKAVVAVSFVNI